MSKIERHLAESKIARNNNKLGYIEYLQKYHCETKIEKAIIEKVLNKGPSGATYKREVAHIQNKLGLYPADFEIQEVRQKQEQELHNKYSSGFFDAVARFFKKY